MMTMTTMMMMILLSKPISEQRASSTLFVFEDFRYSELNFSTATAAIIIHFSPLLLIPNHVGFDVIDSF